MKTDRRELEDWEKAECAALKAAIATFNQAALPKERLTQEQIAQELGMTQGNLSSHLNGKRAITKEIAARIARLIGSPVESFSPRLAKEIADMARAAQAASGPSGISEVPGDYASAPHASAEPAPTEALLEVVAAMHVIQAGLLSGRLTDDQVRRLLQIRNEVVHQHPGSGEQGKRLQGLVAAAFKAEEAGGTPDDLLKMYQLGMEKQFAQEGGSTHEPRKKRAR